MTWADLKITPQVVRDLEPNYSEGKSDSELEDNGRDTAKTFMQEDLKEKLHLDKDYLNPVTKASLDDYTTEYEERLREALTYKQLEIELGGIVNCDIDRVVWYANKYNQIHKNFGNMQLDTPTTTEQSIRIMR